MGNIHLIGGEKGGVGKSVVARILAQYFIDNEIPFIGFDTDGSHGSLLRFYAEYTSPAVIDSYESMDEIVEAAAAAPERRVLVDLAAQTHAPLVKWMDESGVLDLKDEQAISIRYWHVMDSGKDSVELLRTLLDRFRSRLDYTIVLNQLRGDNFDLLGSSGIRERALGLGARFVTIKRLHDAAIGKIDANSTSFWAATHRTENGNVLGLLERQRVKIWLRNAYEEIDAAGI